MIESPYLTCEEAAAYLRFDVTGPDPGSAVRQLVRRGELRPAGRGGRGKLLFVREQLDAWVLRFESLPTEGEPPQRPEEVRRSRAGSAPTRSDDRWGLRALLRDALNPDPAAPASDSLAPGVAPSSTARHLARAPAIESSSRRRNAATATSSRPTCRR